MTTLTIVTVSNCGIGALRLLSKFLTNQKLGFFEKRRLKKNVAIVHLQAGERKIPREVLKLEKFVKFDIIDLGRGAGTLYREGVRLLQDMHDKIVEVFEKYAPCDMLITVAALGGGTGSGFLSTTVLEDIARSLDCGLSRTINIVVVPSEKEVPLRLLKRHVYGDLKSLLEELVTLSPTNFEKALGKLLASKSGDAATVLRRVFNITKVLSSVEFERIVQSSRATIWLVNEPTIQTVDEAITCFMLSAILWMGELAETYGEDFSNIHGHYSIKYTYVPRGQVVRLATREDLPIASPLGPVRDEDIFPIVLTQKYDTATDILNQLHETYRHVRTGATLVRDKTRQTMLLLLHKVTICDLGLISKLLTLLGQANCPIKIEEEETEQTDEYRNDGKISIRELAEQLKSKGAKLKILET